MIYINKRVNYLRDNSVIFFGEFILIKMFVNVELRKIFNGEV